MHDEEELAKYFLCSSVAVMPAAAGLTIQHAFGYGLPIIIGDDMTSHGPEVELVVDGVTGIFCRDGDYLDFAKAIYRLLTDDNLHKQMSINAYEIIKSKYNIKNMADGFSRAIRYCAEKA